MKNEMTCEAPATAKRGFGPLTCPCCGVETESIRIDLSDMTADEALHCHECGATFSLDTIRGVIASWSRVLAWLDSAPILPE